MAAGCPAEAELDLLESRRDSNPGLQMLAAQVLRKSGASAVTSLGAPLNGGGEGRDTHPFPSRQQTGGLQAACDLLGRGPYLRDQPIPTQTGVGVLHDGQESTWPQVLKQGLALNPQASQGCRHSRPLEIKPQNSPPVRNLGIRAMECAAEFTPLSPRQAAPPAPN